MSENINFLNLHKRPTSRRDFVSLGLAVGGATLMAPTVKSLIPFSLGGLAHAENNPLAKPIPYLVFDLAGGAALFANFLTGSKGGPMDLLPSYSLQGWNPRQNQVNTQFGLPMAGGGVSKILTGMTTSASAEALSFLKFGSLLHKADVDTSSNPLSAASLVTSAGVKGKFIANTIGLRNSISGGNSQFAKSNDQLRAYYTSNITDISNVAGLSQTFKDKLNEKAIPKLAKIINRLSHVQASRFLNGSISEEHLKFIDEKYQAGATLMASSLNGDPRQDAIFSAVYNINQNSSVTDENVLRAAVVRACLNGWSGPAVITVNGCDYHDNTQTTGDNKDQEVGTQIGRAIEAAYRLKTPVFIQIITDGGIYPTANTRVWLGDNVDSCMSVVGYFNPEKAPQFRASTPQVGSYTQGQGADRTSLIGDSPIKAAYAAFANYMAVSGRVGEFKDFAPGVFSDRELESVLMF